MNNEEITILIVDDEPEARDLLSMLVTELINVKLIGEAESVDEAIQKVMKLNPELILLDIQMPEKNGFELINELRARGIDVGYIIITAYDQYAIQAIKASAFDYLLKPVDPDELEEEINRYQHYRNQRIINQKIDDLLKQFRIENKIKFNTRTGYIIIDPKEIIYCIADGNYTKIILVNNRKETVTINLGKIMKNLSEESFFRISRSAIINLNYLKRVDNKARTCILLAVDNIALQVARNRLNELGRICDNHIISL